MSRLIDVLNEWQNNLQFREQYKINPDQALHDAGFTLDSSDLKKIKSVLKLKQQLTDSTKQDSQTNE